MNRTQRAFVGVVLAACLATFLYARSQTHNLRDANDDSCRNFIILRDAVNEFHGTVKAFLTAARDARLASANAKNTSRLERRADLETANVYDNLIHNTHLVRATCAQRKKESNHVRTTTTGG